MNLIGQEQTREQLGQFFLAKKKELTKRIKNAIEDGSLIQKLVFVDKINGGKKRRVYQFVAKTIPMKLE